MLRVKLNLCFQKDCSETDDYEMRNNLDNAGVDAHPAVADDHGHDDCIESEIETDVRDIEQKECEVKGEEKVINTTETEDVVKGVIRDTEMTEMGAENEKQTDANGDDAVIDCVGKTVTENEEVEEIETVGTAGNAENDDSVVVGVGNAGDARNEYDGSNNPESESEHDEKNTRDIEDAGQDDGSSTDGTFTGLFWIFRSI